MMGKINHWRCSRAFLPVMLSVSWLTESSSKLMNEPCRCGPVGVSVALLTSTSAPQKSVSPPSRECSKLTHHTLTSVPGSS